MKTKEEPKSLVALTLQLIQDHFDNDDKKFKDDCYEVARRLFNDGKGDCAEWVLAQISENCTFVPMKTKGYTVEKL